MSAGLLAVAAARVSLGAARTASAEAGGAESESEMRATGRRGGAIEALVVLVAVEILFATFVALQLAYLFGGLSTLDATGLTYSAYARQGYFQLVAVVALAGLLVAIVERLAGRSRGFVLAALSFVALTFVILASAGLRLSLYLQAYGWTELRFYVAASILWLAVGGALVTSLLLLRRMQLLVHGLAISAVAITLLVSAIGPQAFIAHENVARALDPSLVPPDGEVGLDALYLAAFSDDAVPEIVAVLDRLDPHSRAALLVALRQRREDLDSDVTNRGWAAWNLSRERARAALAELPDR
jgi:hypothetical protein